LHHHSQPLNAALAVLFKTWNFLEVKMNSSTRAKLFNPHVCGGRGGGNFNAKTSVRFLFKLKKISG
jgi:hypothetical protein